MGLFLCDMCNEQLTFDSPHVCDPGKLRAYIAELELRARKAEHKLNVMEDAVLYTLKELPSLEGEKIEVSTKWLRMLWQAAECRFDKYEEPEAFIGHWMAMHRILCEAFDLFRSRKYGKPSNLLKNLQELKEACEIAKKVLGYQDSVLDLSPEDIVEGHN